MPVHVCFTVLRCKPNKCKRLRNAFINSSEIVKVIPDATAENYIYWMNNISHFENVNYLAYINFVHNCFTTPLIENSLQGLYFRPNIGSYYMATLFKNNKRFRVYFTAS